MRRVGKVGQRRAAALRKLKRLLIARSGNRCEVPWCRRLTKLDPHHYPKRSRGGQESLESILMLCRPHHDQTDWPKGRPGHLEIQRLPRGFLFVMALRDGERLCMDRLDDE